MSNEVRYLQARLKALGFDPGPIDGLLGVKTYRAKAHAEVAQLAKGLPLVHPSGIQRVVMHWTAGRPNPGALDQQHYHVLVSGDGLVHRPHHPNTRLSHTKNANGGAIGVSLCGMHGAKESPFDEGAYPIQAHQIAVMARAVKELCQAYDIPVTPYSVLTHAEIQPTLGITQAAKWDITWLPGMDKPGHPVEVGDRLRAMIKKVVA